MSHALIDGTHPPTEDEIRALLGRKYPLYEAVLGLAPLRPEWRFYGPKYGWSLKLFEKKRNLFYVGVEKGTLAVSFILGAKAHARALESDLPAELTEKVQNARRYPEGFAVPLDVARKADLEPVRLLLEIKRAN